MPLANDTILVARTKHPRVYHERISKLLHSKEPRVTLQATGACIERTV